jgi:hypothetical protein
LLGLPLQVVEFALLHGLLILIRADRMMRFMMFKQMIHNAPQVMRRHHDGLLDAEASAPPTVEGPQGGVGFAHGLGGAVQAQQQRPADIPRRVSQASIGTVGVEVGGARLTRTVRRVAHRSKR